MLFGAFVKKITKNVVFGADNTLPFVDKWEKMYYNKI